MAKDNVEMMKHGAMIGGGAFLVMTLMGQDTETAFSHSIKLAGGVTAYMIMFGHGLPLRVV
jgi:hypothetical protein